LYGYLKTDLAAAWADAQRLANAAAGEQKHS
jgi:hypothetical protein